MYICIYLCMYASIEHTVGSPWMHAVCLGILVANVLRHVLLSITLNSKITLITTGTSSPDSHIHNRKHLPDQQRDRCSGAGFHSRSYAVRNAVRGNPQWPTGWSAGWAAKTSWSISCGSRLPWASDGHNRLQKSRSAPGLENISRCPHKRWCLYGGGNNYSYYSWF